jgi:hypothetical protein
MKRKKILLLIALVILLSGGWYAYREYHRKPADLTSLKPVDKMDALKLAALYETDESKANTLYLGKAIDVSGTITDIQNQQDTMINILLGDSDAMHKVSCMMNMNYAAELKNYKPGDAVTIRGICTGYLMDVELNRCVIINN